ncbi:hypothetical protein BKE38_06920 [Pseudoroseomonas deserti]|uniref:LysR substrate-binding domain-containing protein n=1 Tax=Teichococcus deserti TaxID=1817963 RepID=A0A1V2H5J7_9PROT|nr:LysR substrate-binding domain-containing protein [Pseudoroseomonas deserti]ONG56056.1 hypothetical protein BKE38_06920 [Pseudoroseomonas deserti]
MICEDGMLTRSAMLAGLGVALSRPMLLQQELRDGSLVQLSERGIGNGEDYYLCLRQDGETGAPVRHLAAWLRAAAQERGAAGSGSRKADSGSSA